MFQIVKPGPPEEPKNLEVTAVDDTSINLQWTPGFDGGYNQSFDIQVFDESSGLRILKLKNIRRVEGNKTNILGLTPQTRYLMKIRSWNREGYSNFSDEITITTRCKYTKYHFKHEYLRSRAYICLSLSSPLSSHRCSNLTTIEILVLLSWIPASKEFIT